MSDTAAALAWLERRLPEAPEALRLRMAEAVGSLEGDAATGAIPVLLARAAEECLRATLADPSERPAALHLLAADALLTHACQAAAEQGLGALEALTEAYAPAHFAALAEERLG